MRDPGKYHYSSILVSDLAGFSIFSRKGSNSSTTTTSSEAYSNSFINRLGGGYTNPNFKIETLLLIP